MARVICFVKFLGMGGEDFKKMDPSTSYKPYRLVIPPTAEAFNNTCAASPVLVAMTVASLTPKGDEL